VPRFQYEPYLAEPINVTRAYRAASENVPYPCENSCLNFVGDRTDFEGLRSYVFAIMGQAERPTCPTCGAYLILALLQGGKGKRTFQCFDCDLS
jgi:hypothetical protein